MIIYTKRYVNLVSLLISIIIYIFFTITSSSINSIDFNPLYISNIFKRNWVLVEINANNINQKTKDQNNQTLKETEENKRKELNWKIIIPKISVEAEISEGTSGEVMNKYVGHFEETSKSIGNIGLAAHNRGYEVNYFAQLKKLKQGDEIIYKYYDFEKTYTIVENVIIKDTDWSCLEEKGVNRITLITCVENEPEYRRCVQGIEKDKEGGN